MPHCPARGALTVRAWRIGAALLHNQAGVVLHGLRTECRRRVLRRDDQQAISGIAPGATLKSRMLPERTDPYRASSQRLGECIQRGTRGGSATSCAPLTAGARRPGISSRRRSFRSELHFVTGVFPGHARENLPCSAETPNTIIPRTSGGDDHYNKYPKPLPTRIGACGSAADIRDLGRDRVGGGPFILGESDARGGGHRNDSDSRHEHGYR